ncbi:MAG: phosphate ABC transporter permease PstA [Phycisphaerales bacterium]
MSLPERGRPTVGPEGAPQARSGRRASGGGRRSTASVNSMLAQGRPMMWLTGGSLAICLVMIVGLLGLVLYQGGTTFWPGALVRVTQHNGTVVMGEITRTSEYAPTDDELEAAPDAARAAAESELAVDGLVTRRLFRTGNFDLTGEHFRWVSDYSVEERDEPEWALLLERQSWGRFYGFPVAFEIDGERVATDPDEVWALYQEHHADARERYHKRVSIEEHDIGRNNRMQESARLALRRVEMRHGEDSPQYAAQKERTDARIAAALEDAKEIRARIDAINAENARYSIILETAQGQEKPIFVADIVRAFPPNQLSFGGKFGVYLSRWGEFLSADPREANSEGGVYPAIFGTVVMTLIMSLAVVPFGVLAALYLREYAKGGFVVSAVRIAVNNLAGVPSIVFGVFGLGFFCYLVGGTIDEVLFSEKLPNPTYGKGGVLWASLTLALLTLPVVIVATEESLAAVPSSMRNGSYACGASKWQTIKRIVLPRAMPGIMTGMILAMARGAGEVAPLMLVGAVKLAPELPIDTTPPFVHPERSFMHLGFHIYDLGFQSQNSEAAKPMVYTTTLLLITIVAALNIAAIFIRGRLRRKFKTSAF